MSHQRGVFFVISGLIGMLCTDMARADGVVESQAADGKGRSHAPLNVESRRCTEYAGFLPVPVANVAALVPAPFQIASFVPGVANVVVRVAQCKSVKVAGRETGDGIVAQIGVNIVAPDGTGDINNYTLFYDTTGEELARALRRSGVRAELDRDLAYDRDDNPDGVSAHLAIRNGSRPGPRFSFDNQVSIPTASTPAITFTANWWQLDDGDVSEMASVFPGILFGPSSLDVTIRVPAGSALAAILGATSATFAGLSVANDVPLGLMQVRTVER